MRQSVCAVLARHNGNRKAAIAYAVRMARTYKHLRAEYKQILLALRCIQILGR
jgi:hypothetical protein